ncbi:MAG TPA: hypothetical protein VGE29_01480 [Prosthecobacter sp.]
MKFPFPQRLAPALLLALLTLGQGGTLSAQEGATAAPAPPVPFPELSQYSPLWERSLLTTRDLPSPDAPVGPVFTDSLSLAGVYEVDGQVVAVLVDRTTSLISEARMNVENEAGIKIRKVTPGATMDKTRVQLQKGDQAGWVAFAELAGAPATPAKPPGLQTRQPTPQAPGQGGGLVSPLLPPPPAIPSPGQGGTGTAPAAPPADVPLPPP